MGTTKNAKRVIRIILYAVAFFCGLVILGFILAPKYRSSLKEGSLIDDYYSEPKEHTVLFLGDCEVYQNINPVVIWDRCGVASVVRGTPNQTMPMSYYVLLETLEYEKPKVVVLSILSLTYDRYIKEEYNRLTFDRMKNSGLKYRAISSCTEDNILSYMFPVIRYHDRFDKLKKEDFDLTASSVSYMGFLPRTEIKAYEGFPVAPKLPDYSFDETNVSYLDKIVSVCKDINIRLVLCKAPTLYPYWYDEWDRQVVEYASKNGLEYINYLECADEMGLDYSTDTYDGGYHLNVSGAYKWSTYLCDMFSKESATYSDECVEYYKNMCKEYHEKYED
ncbi:MAG TPA: hypothetical protein DCX21_06890 [Eubacterium sp.]|nr:hypothetical protein [Eubacterium sp.]